MNWNIVAVCLMSASVTGMGVWVSCTKRKDRMVDNLILDAAFAIMYALAMGWLWGILMICKASAADLSSLQ